MAKIIKQKNINEESNLVEKEFKAQNYGGYVKVNLCTGGRFDFPETVYFKPYTMEDLTDLESCKPEDLQETLIAILNKNKHESITTDCELLKLEEVIDIEARLYGSVFDPNVEYPIDEECKNEECERTNPIFAKLNINQLNILSVENVEDNIRDNYRELFNNPDIFEDYVKIKYGEGEQISIDQALSDIKLKEPLNIRMDDGKTLRIRFVTIGDLAYATKKAYVKYSYALRKVNKKKYSGLSPEDAKIQKEMDFEDIQIEMFKEISSGVNALSLLGVDKQEFRTFDEKLDYYKNMPPKYANKFKENSEITKFGINHTIETNCPSCKEKKIYRLEHGSLLYDFLPIGNSRLNKTDENISTEGKQGRPQRISIYF